MPGWYRLPGWCWRPRSPQYCSISSPQAKQPQITRPWITRRTGRYLVRTRLWPGYTFHGDFMNAWDPAELQRRVDNCIRAGYICGTDGNPIQQ